VSQYAAQPQETRMKKATATKEKTTKKEQAEPKATPRAYTFYDVFSKQRGYLCSCIDENAVHKTLYALFRENEKYWHRDRSEGKKSRAFDCYGIARCGNSSRIIELMFEEETETDTYDDVVEQSNK
jgi:hypothetical protein